MESKTVIGPICGGREYAIWIARRSGVELKWIRFGTWVERRLEQASQIRRLILNYHKYLRHLPNLFYQFKGIVDIMKRSVLHGQ